MKTMMKAAAAMFWLGAAVPIHAQTTGSLNVSLQVNPPVADTVQIFGLNDLAFSPITRVAGEATNITYSSVDAFCIVRSGSNPNSHVNVKVTQSGGASPTGKLSLNGSGGKIMDGVFLFIESPDNTSVLTNTHDAILSVRPSNAGCTEASGSSVANEILFESAPITADSAASDGALSQTFTLEVSIP